MADYVSVISRAVAGLAVNNPANRTALYMRARAAFVVQLGMMPPPLTQAELAREQAALERAIRTVEAQHARAPSHIKSETSAPRSQTITPIAPMPKLFPRANTWNER